MSEERVSEKFTPGPWQIDDDEGALRLFVYSEEYGNICTVSLFDQRDREAVLLGETPEDDPNKKEYLDFDKITANANILAAAPDMYAALQGVCRKCWDKPRLAEDFDGDPLDRPCGECPVRKAMAKARGEK